MQKMYYVAYQFKTKGLFYKIGQTAEILVTNITDNGVPDVNDMVAYLIKYNNYDSIIILSMIETMSIQEKLHLVELKNNFVN